ncbi:MAG: hypothetical protein PF518_02655 [Spirochaetaceae bacterium]|jgi:hypothetical protein|nr:hypothetical protein [Spirochaetaceae bacterium]
MYNNREEFLDKQIGIYELLIVDLENSNMNGKEKKDLEMIKVLHDQYINEKEELLQAQEVL